MLFGPGYCTHLRLKICTIYLKVYQYTENYNYLLLNKAKSNRTELLLLPSVEITTRNYLWCPATNEGMLDHKVGAGIKLGNNKIEGHDLFRNIIEV